MLLIISKGNPAVYHAWNALDEFWVSITHAAPVVPSASPLSYGVRLRAIFVSQIVLESRNITADWVEHQRVAAEAQNNEFTVSMAEQVRNSVGTRQQSESEAVRTPVPVTPHVHKELSQGRSEAHGLLSRPNNHFSTKAGGHTGVVRALPALSL